MYKKLITAGSIISTVALMSGIALAQDASTINQQSRSAKFDQHQLADTKITDFAVKLGLNADEIKQELKAGKNLQKILAEHNIPTAKVQELFGNQSKSTDKKAKFANLKAKVSLKNIKFQGNIKNIGTQMIQAEANVLGLTVDQVKTAHQNHQFKQLLDNKGLSKEQFHQQIVVQIKQFIASGVISSTDAPLYDHLIKRFSKNTTSTQK